jgi:signal transduction histidine kinase
VVTSGRRIASALSPGDVHAAVLDAVIALLRVDAAALVDLTVSQPRAVASRGEMRVDFALAARVAQSGAPLIEPAAQAGLRSTLCAPVFVAGRPALCLIAASRHVDGQFGADDERLASFIAHLAGAALENADNFAQVRRAEQEIRGLRTASVRAQEEERRRLAQALHDGTGQTLSVLQLHLGILARELSSQPAARKLTELQSVVESTMADVRGLSRDLRPAALDRLGLAAALADLAESSSAPGFAVRFEGDPAQAVPASTGLALFRIAQAALGNTLAHAQARSAVIRLAQESGQLVLSLEDDGRGFDAARMAPGAGIGLVGMRERAAWLGGVLRIDSAPGSGTRIRVEVPLDSVAAVG